MAAKAPVSAVDELLQELAGLRVLHGAVSYSFLDPRSRLIDTRRLIDLGSEPGESGPCMYAWIDDDVYRFRILITRITHRSPPIGLMMDAEVDVEFGVELVVDKCDPVVDDDIMLSVKEAIRSLGQPELICELRGRCSCAPPEPGCIDGIYAVDERTSCVVLDVAPIAVLRYGEWGARFMRFYDPGGLQWTPWLEGKREA